MTVLRIIKILICKMKILWLYLDYLVHENKYLIKYKYTIFKNKFLFFKK